jgi:hypothetical protein
MPLRLCELNGLPDWAPDLLAAHPKAFDVIIHRELAWEIERPADSPEPYYIVSTLRLVRYGGCLSPHCDSPKRACNHPKVRAGVLQNGSCRIDTR